MSEAPARIWVWWDDAYDVGLVNTHGDKRYTPEDAREYVRADRIEELEAKLAKAVEALEFYATHNSDDNGRHARNTLAEVKGQDDGH